MASVTDDPVSRPHWLAAALGDFIFLIVALRAIQLGQTELLNDPGTPWHVRVGLDVWESGPPRVDRYSYTRAGEAWISQHWLCDAAVAVLYRAWGWNGPVLASALVLGWTYRGLFRTVLDCGANVAWAAALTVLAAGCAAPHWLARPHLLSLWFLLLTFRWCLDYHRSGRRVVWAVPAVMVVWCNVHGAFLAGLVVIACSLIGHLLSGPRDFVRLQRIIGFSAVLALALLATLVNPYGWHLHAHLGDILFGGQLRDLIDEWRAPDFASSDSRPLEALLLLGLLLLAVAGQRLDAFSLVHLVVWVHFGLTSVRQVASLAVIAAPVMGGLTAGLGAAIRERFSLGRWLNWTDEVGRRAMAWATEERMLRWPVWSGVLSVLLVLATAFGVSAPALGIGVARLPEARWPVAAVERLNAEPPDGRLFHDLNWGGYLILLSRPQRPVFIDDRFELYGRPFLVEYLGAMQYGDGWRRLLERYEFQYVLIPPNVPLGRVLRGSPDWEALHADETAVLFRRR
jgi:hypothetical protein